MSEAGYEFGDTPNVYEIEQIAWSNGKGQKCILLIEAYSMTEAIKLSGEGDGIHEVIGAKQIGSICIRSPKLNEISNVLDELTIVSSEEWRLINKINEAPDMVRVTVDMPRSTFKNISKHIKKSPKNMV
jgi:hypothetical protein